MAKPILSGTHLPVAWYTQDHLSILCRNAMSSGKLPDPSEKTSTNSRLWCPELPLWLNILFSFNAASSVVVTRLSGSIKLSIFVQHLVHTPLGKHLKDSPRRLYFTEFFALTITHMSLLSSQPSLYSAMPLTLPATLLG